MSRIRVRRPLARRAATAAVLTLGSVLGPCLIGPLVGPTSAGASTSPSAITITQTTAPVQGACLPAAFALSRNVVSTADEFRLHIVVTAPLCEPIVAAAVVYGMPGGGLAWDQTLRERREFTLSAAGTTDVVFRKTCAPAQFDVLVGDSPPVIGPFGPWHGPLLFPFDDTTAQQWWGYPCPVTATSDLQVVKTVDTRHGTAVGDIVRYTLVATNNGPDLAHHVVVTDYLPGGIRVVASSPSTGTFDAGTGEWAVGDLAVGATAALTIDVEITSPVDQSTVVNRAAIASDSTDPNPGNDRSAVDFVGTPLVRPAVAALVGVPMVGLTMWRRRRRRPAS